MGNTAWVATVAPPLPVVLPLLMAAALTTTGNHLPRWLLDALATVMAVVVTVLCAALVLQSHRATIVYAFGGWRPHGTVVLGVLFVIDPIGAGLATLAGILVSASLLFSWHYFDAVEAHFHVLMLVFLAAMVGFCLTGDIFDLFVFFELMGVAAYALTGYKIEDSGPLQGALNFAISNSMGAFLVLFGIGLLYARTGALNFAQIGHALAGKAPDGLIVAAFVLITAGFLVKAAVAPFHFWLPDAHAVAPSPVCVLFSGVMVELGLYAVARIYWTIFAGVPGFDTNAFRGPLLAIGTLTALLGGVMCMLQHHIKRLLAFSTVAHAGMFVLGFAMLTPLGLAGTSLYVIGHALTKGALFLGAGILLNQLKSVDENRLRGRGRHMWGTAALFFVGGFNLAALVPLTLFWGKSALEAAASSSGYLWVAGVLVLSSILSAGPVLRVAGSVFLGWGTSTGDDPTATNEGQEHESESSGPSGHAPLVMLVPAMALLVAGCLLGLTPTLIHSVDIAATHFTDQRAYLATVLGAPARAGAPGGPFIPVQFDIPAALSSVLSVGGAITYALLALFWARLPDAPRRLVERVTRGSVAWLRALQSGHVGDYVAWILAGTAFLGVAYTFVLR